MSVVEIPSSVYSSYRQVVLPAALSGRLFLQAFGQTQQGLWGLIGCSTALAQVQRLEGERLWSLSWGTGYLTPLDITGESGGRFHALSRRYDGRLVGLIKLQTGDYVVFHSQDPWVPESEPSLEWVVSDRLPVSLSQSVVDSAEGGVEATTILPGFSFYRDVSYLVTPEAILRCLEMGSTGPRGKWEYWTGMVGGVEELKNKILPEGSKIRALVFEPDVAAILLRRPLSEADATRSLVCIAGVDLASLMFTRSYEKEIYHLASNPSPYPRSKPLHLRQGSDPIRTQGGV